MRRAIRERVPAPLKTLIRAALNPRARLRLHNEARRRSARLRALVRELRGGKQASVETYTELVGAWGNEDYAASPEYLAAIAAAMREMPGPVLECGSGLSTIVLAIEGERYGVDVYALEHDPAWAARTRAELERHRRTRAHVIRCASRAMGSSPGTRFRTTCPSRFRSWYAMDRPRTSAGATAFSLS
jgi:hypothetical protein